MNTPAISTVAGRGSPEPHW